MIVQISSGQGPAECELAVAKLYDSLKSEYSDIRLISKHETRMKHASGVDGGCTSIMFSTDSDLSGLEGTVQWICESPIRPHHKRKNWFVDVSIIEEAELTDELDEQDVRFERFHCGGNGGQNVNKVETGVRLVHIPTGIAVTSTEERTQLMNRNRALKKLRAILQERRQSEQAGQTHAAWREHTRLVRGNPVRVYEGRGFVLRRNRDTSLV